jgi:RNA polymerase sigma factor (sigma-70 family)
MTMRPAAAPRLTTRWRRNAAIQINMALLQLSPEYRTVVVLRHFAGQSYGEIAEALAIPEKTVKSRLYSARQRLGELLLGWRERGKDEDR